MQGCDSGEVTSGETGEELQMKGYLASAKFSSWTMSDCSDGESAGDEFVAGGEFVGRAWVEEHSDDGQGVVLSGNGVDALCLVRLEGRYSYLSCDAL